MTSVAPRQPAPGSVPAPSPAHVGTLVGESTSREFRLALAHESVREQDIIAVDAHLRSATHDGAEEQMRVWAKVLRIERINPLFPSEAGHELAASHTDVFDTILSLSREMVTAVCQVLGAEPLADAQVGRLEPLRYPAQPAASAYVPRKTDVERIILGELISRPKSALDVAHLSNRQDVDVRVDGSTLLSRHAAILAMTGAGKSWAARRIIEQVAAKNYPIVIFDPHGDYSGLAEDPQLRQQVRPFYARFPLFEEDGETVGDIISSLAAWSLTPAMQGRFPEVFAAAKEFCQGTAEDLQQRCDWLSNHTGDEGIRQYGVRENLWLVATLAEACETAIRNADATARQFLEDNGWPRAIRNYTGTDASTLEGIKKRTRKAAKVLQRMENASRRAAGTAEPLPANREELVQYGQITLLSLAGYTPDFQATIYSLIASDLFSERIKEDGSLPVLLVLEEAHTFVPGKANTPAEERSILTTRQIAQEGRKFGLGLLLISQRPSRLDETALSQCNSYVILRMVNPNDQNFVKRVVESLSEDELRLLPGLKDGEAILAGQFINFPILAQMKSPTSPTTRGDRDAFDALERARSLQQDRQRQRSARR